MDQKKPDAKEALSELMENLGTIGGFMLRESRAFLNKSWGASREEFMEAVDHTAGIMKQSGKTAVDDIERAAEKIKKSWSLLDHDEDLEWDTFRKELTARLNAMGDISKETFELCVNQARDALDKQWNALGPLREGSINAVQEQTEQMAKAFKSQWSVFLDAMEQTGKRIDRAVDAAWNELKKKD